MAGTWSSGGALATARYALAGCGTQTAGLSFGGLISAASAVTEEYTITPIAGGRKSIFYGPFCGPFGGAI